MTEEEEITALSAKWIELLHRDAWKNKDCHFWIEKVWSDGEKPYYRAHHYGYIAGRWQSPKCATSAGAQGMLLRFLREIVADAEANPPEEWWGDDR